ncbi:uncharacterized protein CLUP02_05158 [Colletotrichum lupini]|uniref:Uncharacterized protein n=1 Tax=Colletotrichum lupini TaxID=145971 RepID=A0A9Q8SM01_9PEZI|nr:uncharacterized protein CLUP02_05158 [Colletotrichum lupini]UQC79678.1 hypothetical protein CLUP02_05158 [Colletotrichum lupini]
MADIAWTPRKGILAKRGLAKELFNRGDLHDPRISSLQRVLNINMLVLRLAGWSTSQSTSSSSIAASRYLSSNFTFDYQPQVA